MLLEPRPFLKWIELNKSKDTDTRKYPFNIPLIKNLQKLEFDKDITFIIGENGSGKSTLIEAIAIAYGFNSEGGNKNTKFHTEESHSSLSECIKIVKSFERPTDGYFLRAESFYNLASFMDTIPDFLPSYGGISLHEQSHGESFIALLKNKLHGHGLYIFDEPEAALSPMRQIEALQRIKELNEDESQFIIATHSPILLSYPKATIYEIKNGELQKVKYTETEHFRVT